MSSTAPEEALTVCTRVLVFPCGEHRRRRHRHRRRRHHHRHRHRHRRRSCQEVGRLVLGRLTTGMATKLLKMNTTTFSYLMVDMTDEKSVSGSVASSEAKGDTMAALAIFTRAPCCHSMVGEVLQAPRATSLRCQSKSPRGRQSSGASLRSSLQQARQARVEMIGFCPGARSTKDSRREREQSVSALASLLSRRSLI